MERVFSLAFRDLNLECSICYDNITEDISCSRCCNNFFHKSCVAKDKLYQSGTRCLACNQSNSSISTDLIDIAVRLIKNGNSAAFVSAIRDACLTDIVGVRAVDNTIRSYLNESYPKLLGGCFEIPEYCKFIESTELKTGLYRSGENVWCNRLTFLDRLDEFTYGLLTNYTYPEGFLITGATIPALLGAKNYAHSNCEYIDIVIYSDTSARLESILNNFVEHIRCTIGDLTSIIFATRQNFLYIKITGISRLIKIELFTTYTSRFEVMTNYSLSRYEMCQSYYDGNTINMTIKAIMSYAHQKTYTHDTFDVNINEHFNKMGYRVTWSKTTLITLTPPLLHEFTDQIDYTVLKQHTLPQAPILIAEIKCSSIIETGQMEKIIADACKETGITAQVKQNPLLLRQFKIHLQQGKITTTYDKNILRRTMLVEFIKRKLQ